MASSPPSQDAIASLITQVSPTGQPARAPSRPVRPRQGQAKKAPTNGAKKATTTGAAAASADKPKENTTSTTFAAANDAGEAAPAPATAAATVQLADDSSAARGDSTYGTEETAAGSTSESSTKPLTAASTATMHPATSSVHTSTPPSTGQSTKQRPSSQDITSTPPKLSSSQQANKPKHLQKEAPHTSGAGGSTSSASLQKKRAKRKSWISSLFSSCFTGGAGHGDDGEHSNTSNNQMTERKAGTANATRNVKPATTTVGTSTPTTTATPNTTSAHNQDSKHANTNKDVAMVTLTKGDDKNDSTSKLTHPTESTSGTGTTSSREIVSQPLPDSTSQSNIGGGALLLPLSASTASGLGSGSSPKSEIAPEILAANQAGGTPLSRDETGDVLSGAVQAPGSEGLTPKKEKRRKSSSGERSIDGAAGGGTSRVSSLHDESGNEEAVEDSEAEEEEEEEEYVDEEERIIAAGGMGIPIDEDGNPAPLLKELTPAYKGKKCLVLDLDETLVHSSFKLIHSPDFVVPVEIENTVHNVYVIKRPGVDAFMKRMGELYEVVVFTASLSKYADPVLDQLDIHKVVEHRLFRESCYNHRGNYVKDLSQLGREIGDTIIIDNSPASYIFHPNNAVPVSSWFNDPHDTELTDLQGFLADLAEVPDVRGVLDGGLFPIQ